MDKPGGYAKILKTRAPCPSPSPPVNRATFGQYVPGSIFKVVTASARLDTGGYRPARPSSTRASRRVRPQGDELLRPERARCLRPGDADPGARELDQLGLLQHRQGDGAEAHRRLHEAVRLLRGAAAGDAGERAAPRRAVRRTGSCSSPRTRARSTPAGSPSARSACRVTPLQMSDGGGGRSQRLGRDGAARRPADPGARRHRHSQHPPQGARARGPARDCGPVDRDDERRRGDGHRHGRPDPRRGRRREDRHRRGRVAGRNTVWFITFAPADDPKSPSPSWSRPRAVPAASMRPRSRRPFSEHFYRRSRVPPLDSEGPWPSKTP